MGNETKCENIIGREVEYSDYSGLIRTGKIVAIEPCETEPGVAYLYIFDNNDMDANDKVDIVYGKEVRYADIRPSIECTLLNN